MLINITDTAAEQLTNMLKEQGESTKKIRIMITGVGWAGPRFGIALDEQKEDDRSFTKDDFEFILDQRLANYSDSLTIDYRDSFLSKGFKIYFNSPFSGSC